MRDRIIQAHPLRTRADRKTLTVPVTAAELAIVDKQARRAGLTRAEFVRRLVLPREKSSG